jgi:hypothetical protein
MSLPCSRLLETSVFIFGRPYQGNASLSPNRAWAFRMVCRPHGSDLLSLTWISNENSAFLRLSSVLPVTL